MTIEAFVQAFQVPPSMCHTRAWRSQKPYLIMLGAITVGCECGSKKLRVSDGVEFNVISITTKDE